MGGYVAAGCLVLVDGWNHFIAAQTCYGYALATKFPIDRLARHLASETGELAVSDAVVVMAIPDRNQPGEEPDFWAWRNRLKKLHNFGVNHAKARFSYHDLKCSGCGTTLDRAVTCKACARLTPLAGRRKEKGADTRLAALALNGAWEQAYSTLIVLSQDSDFGPVIEQVKQVHQRQNRRYALYSAYPVCDEGHEHRKVPGTNALPLTKDVYAKLAEQPYANPLG
jgi:uncharacterized LabA/DUF88 family protein